MALDNIEILEAGPCLVGRQLIDLPPDQRLAIFEYRQAELDILRKLTGITLFNTYANELNQPIAV